jgi:CRISPR-associated protein Cmr6
MARTSESARTPTQPLPRGIVDILADRPRPRDGDNLGLWLDKLLPLDPDNFDLAKDTRERVLGDIFVARDLGAPRPWRSHAAGEALERLRASCKLLYGANCLELKAELRGRLLLDYARISTIESSISMHATLGVPRITGSALKGLLRATLRQKLAPTELDILLGSPDLEASQSNETVHRRGRLVLHDALPQDGEFQLDLDGLTPHFRDYYEADADVPPADWLSPVPHTFLTVVKTTFRLFIGLLPDTRRTGPDQKRREPDQQADQNTLKLVEDTLINALWEDGIGAKRAAAYGRFKAKRA